ncbi:MAG: hypothetical protein JO317_00555 [Verrucomicrobiae bacterium]|nr:hypothetical protein [Verrucomicrobiae bacterium]
MRYSTFIDKALLALEPAPMKTSLVRGTLQAKDWADRIAGAGVSELIEPHTLNSGFYADLLKAGLLLWVDDFERSHRYAQEVHTHEGSYWHAILHRREPDYMNALHWYSQIGSHSVFHQLAKSFPGWSPERFVRDCQRASPNDAELLAVQAKEFELLFDFTFAQAIHRKKPLNETRGPRPR